MACSDRTREVQDDRHIVKRVQDSGANNNARIERRGVLRQCGRYLELDLQVLVLTPVFEDSSRYTNSRSFRHGLERLILLERVDVLNACSGKLQEGQKHVVICGKRVVCLAIGQPFIRS